MLVCDTKGDKLFLFSRVKHSYIPLPVLNFTCRASRKNRQLVGPFLQHELHSGYTLATAEHRAKFCSSLRNGLRR
jgi:hypothetical protein